MATSGSYDYSLTAATIIQDALENIGVVQNGESVDSDDQSVALRTLNMPAKQWQGTADQAQGFKMFLRQIVYMFLQLNQTVYNIGPAAADDHATTTYYTTTLDAAEAAGQTTLSVASTASMANSDQIGIELDSGAIQWTTVSSFVANDTVTIAAVGGLTGAAASGNTVFYYTTKAQRLTDIMTAVLRNSDGTDLPITFFRTVQDYEALPDKSAEGDPYALLVEPLRIKTKITLDYAPQDVTKVIRMVALYPSEDYDATTDDIAYPQEWFAALSWELARRLAPKFEKSWTPERQANWESATTIARQLTPQDTSAYFQPGREDWQGQYPR